MRRSVYPAWMTANRSQSSSLYLNFIRDERPRFAASSQDLSHSLASRVNCTSVPPIEPNSRPQTPYSAWPRTLTEGLSHHWWPWRTIYYRHFFIMPSRRTTNKTLSRFILATLRIRTVLGFDLPQHLLHSHASAAARNVGMVGQAAQPQVCRNTLIQGEKGPPDSHATPP